jgi:trigger factor
MLQQVETLSPTTRKLTISVPKEVIQSETDSIYNRIQMTTNIPGFRPGRVPRAILQKRFGKNVEAQIIEKVVPEYYMKAVEEASIEPVGYPKIDDRIEVKPGEPLSFSVTVEVKPEVEGLNYEGITLKKKEADVTDEEVEKSINLLRESKALYSSTEEPLQKDDMAIIDCEAFCDNEKIEELTHKEFPFVLGSDAMPEEFSDGLTGARKGDEKEIKVSFADDYPNSTVAGKEIVFKVKVAEGKKKNLPPLDDDFAKDADCETMDELRNKIRENLLKRKKDRINLEYKKEILDELLKRHEVDAPSSMIESEIESLVMQKKQEAARKGEDAGTDEDLIKAVRPRAEENVKSVLILEAIGKKENIEVTEDEISKSIEEIADRHGLKPDEVRKLYAVREGSMDALKSRLFGDKVLEFILEKSTIEE